MPTALRIFTEPQEGATYDDLLAVAQETERLGFDAFFRSDHYMAIFGDGVPGPTDAWVTLGALARETERIKLGTLVSPVTFRLPGRLAIIVAQVDAMSGGRVELGLGAGWFDGEHAAYGIPFPPTGERFDRLEEQLEVITGLWATPVGSRFDYEGTYYQLSDSPALPKPVQSPPPIMLGGGGKKRTPALAARFAAEFNMPFSSVERSKEQFDVVRAACEAAGRDPSTMTFSVAQTLCVGSDEAEVARRAEAIGQSVDQLRAGGLGGTVPEVVDKVGRLVEAGAERIYLQTLDLQDLDHLRLVAAEVAPAVP
jgi:F420-dependent oxidoreductase-like protein